jgi:nickel-dependent lactate racemase
MNNNFKIKYGKETLELNIGKPVDILEIESANIELSENDIHRKIFDSNVTTLIENSEKILFILPDVTRKSGAEKFIKLLLDLAEDKNKHISFIFALGTHRQMTPDEEKAILSGEIYSKYKNNILPQNASDKSMFTEIGSTSRGTNIRINKAYNEHDLIIPIGSVSYHYFAGFGGGRKLLIPGISEKECIMHNHALVLDIPNKTKHHTATTGKLEGNPVNDDLSEAVKTVSKDKNIFLVNSILDDSNNIVDIICGDLFDSHKKACERLVELTSVKVEKLYDAAIVSCGGFPKDINMVQAQKSLDRATLSVKKGGKILFLAENIDGYGNSYFQQFFDHTSLDAMFNELAEDYQINKQTAYNLRTNLTNYDVFLKSKFDDADATRIGFKPFNDLTKIKELFEDSDKVAVIPFAYNIYFSN